MRTPPRRLHRWQATAAIAATTAARRPWAPPPAPLSALPLMLPALLVRPRPGRRATRRGSGRPPAASKVWYTLTGGTMSEVYYPSGRPEHAELQFAVTDGSSWTQLETDGTVTRARSLVDPSPDLPADQHRRAGRGGSPRRTSPTRPGRRSSSTWRFEALTAGACVPAVCAVRPVPRRRSGQGLGEHVGRRSSPDRQPHSPERSRSALVSSAPFVRDLDRVRRELATARRPAHANHTLSTTYAAAGPGNIAQVGQIPVTGDQPRRSPWRSASAPTPRRRWDRQRQPGRSRSRTSAGRIPGGLAPPLTKSLNRAPKQLDARLTASTGPR